MNRETLLEFPCEFPIKIMGRVETQLDITVIEIAQRHAPNTTTEKLKSRLSKDGNYLAITIIVEVHNKQQLDAIYYELSAHPHVLMAL